MTVGGVPLDNYLKLIPDKYWKKTVGALIGAIWLYTLADIAASVTGFVNGLLDFSGFRGWVELLAGDKGPGEVGLGDLLEYFFPLLVLLGYLLFYLALSDFMRLQRSASDRSAVHGICLAYILFFIAALACYLWWPGKLAALVLVIIGYVKLLTGYHRLKRSAHWIISVGSVCWYLSRVYGGFIPPVLSTPFIPSERSSR